MTEPRRKWGPHVGCGLWKERLTQMTRVLKAGAGCANGWGQRFLEWTLLGMVTCVGIGGCSPTEVAPEVASEPEQIGQIEQAVTNSAYVPAGYMCKVNDEFGGTEGG